MNHILKLKEDFLYQKKIEETEKLRIISEYRKYKNIQKQKF